MTGTLINLHIILNMPYNICMISWMKKKSSTGAASRCLLMFALYFASSSLVLVMEVFLMKKDVQPRF